MFTFLVKAYGGIAQLGEHLPCKQGVSGSIPLVSTIQVKHHLVKHIENYIISEKTNC